MSEEKTPLESNDTAKEVASKYIGKYGLFYITLIILIGVGSSAWLSESAVTAVMTMIGGALVALINMMQGVTGTRDEDTNAEIIKDLIEKLDMEEKPMKVNVEGDQVTVSHGESQVTTNKY
jgi:hypothetical protein